MSHGKEKKPKHQKIHQNSHNSKQYINSKCSITTISRTTHHGSNEVNYELSKSQSPNDSTKDLIIKTINEQNPQTTRQLVDLIQQTTNLSENEIVKVLNQLETEGKVHFSAEPETSSSFGTYLFSFKSAWYWTIMAVALVTTLTVFTVPPDLLPIAYLRNVLGVIFVLFLPGYAFVKAIFQNKVPIKTTSESFDNIERLVLSIALSIAITPMVGMVLYYTPIGIGLTPITLTLLALTLILATAALARDYRAKKDNIQQPYSDSKSSNF